MNKDQFKNLQAKLESIWNEDSFIVNDAPRQAPAGTAGQPGSKGPKDAEKVMVAKDARKLPPNRRKRDAWRVSQGLANLRAAPNLRHLAKLRKEEQATVSEATQGPGVDAVMELIDMGVSKEDLFDQMMRDHSDDELLSFADDYRRMNDFPGMED